MESIKNFSYFALYIELLILAVLFAIAVPNVIEDKINKVKVLKLVDKIFTNEKVEIYDIDLLQNLLKGEGVNVKYIKFLLLQLVKKAHDKNDKERLEFFKNLNETYNSNELYNQLPPQYKNLINDLKKHLGETNGIVISNLSNTISELVAKDDKSSKLNKFLTIVSILVTLLSIILPFISLK